MTTTTTIKWITPKVCEHCPIEYGDEIMHLKKGRVDDIKADLAEGGHFVCHKTIGDKQLMCRGAYNYLKSINKPNKIMRLAKGMGYDD